MEFAFTVFSGFFCVMVACVYANTAAKSKEVENQKVQRVLKDISVDYADDATARHKRTSESKNPGHTKKEHSKKRNQGTKSDKKEHKVQSKKKQNTGTKNVTASDKEDSIYANKKVDVNQKAKVVGGETKSDMAVQPVKLNPAEVADNDLKTGVSVMVVIVIVAVLAIVAAVCISQREKIREKLANMKDYKKVTEE